MKRTIALLAALPLAACTISQGSRLPSSQEAFWDALQSHCGKAYRGRLVSEDARDADWKGRAMIAHWAACDERKVAIAFHTESGLETSVGNPVWDRSRTWIISRQYIENAARSTPIGLELKHDHRHEDGEPDTVTFYGGLTQDKGTPRAQDFPVDRCSSCPHSSNRCGSNRRTPCFTRRTSS
ncbi:MAG: hypothetical protein ACM308_05850 [Qipengyuania vulgaris]